MISRQFTLSLAILLSLTVSALAQGKKEDITQNLLNTNLYREVFAELVKLRPDPTKVASVTDLMIQRDAATLVFESGELYLCNAVRGRVCAAVFVGRGALSYTPTTDVEREHLGRFYEKEGLQEPFSSLVMFFADSTLEDLKGMLELKAGTVSPKAAAAVEEAIKFIAVEDAGYIHSGFMNAVLNEETNAFFHASIATENMGPLFFEVNPYEAEEVMLMRQAKGTTYKYGTDVVNQFHLHDEYLRGIDPNEDKARVKIESYRIDCSIATDLEMSAAATIAFKPLQQGLRWVEFSIYPELIVDSITWGNGMPARFVKTGGDLLWIEMRQPLASDAGNTLRLHYHGPMMAREAEWIYLKSSLLWYPHHGYLNTATFDLTFRVPERYHFASVGEQVSSDEEEGVKISRWVTKKPIRNASFNIGVFKEYTIEHDTLPPITVYMNKSGHSQIAEQRIKQGVTSGKDMEKQVAEDVASSIALFEYMYGNCPVDRLYATEIPQSHGEAFPGLIHLWWQTFQQTDKNGFDEFFRAHEVSHQWWGIGLDFKTYHDQWLSEGFATYSGLLFVQAVRKNNERFFYWLKQYRDEMLNNRKSIFGSGQQAGPIWLGHRTVTSTTQGDYDLIIYKKGAWVIHMIRNLLMDPNTMNEDKFRALMRDFYGTYAGRQATTEDFQAMLEKHTGTPMDWFFGQWVYGTGIPRYTCSYTVQDMPDGKYLLKCRVLQDGVPEDFRMPMMVRIDFGEKGATRGRRMIQGPRTEFELVLPMKPEEVVFNDLESVLCELETTGWK